jgi:hypothetical protein
MVAEIIAGYREIKKNFLRAAKYAKKVDFNIKKIDDNLQEESSSSSSASHSLSLT